MSPSDKSTEQDEPLRLTAEEQLAKPTLSDTLARPANELLHQIQLHQSELEMQNQALRQVQLALEESRARYVDLFDFAPVGYLKLGADGIIDEINLTGARLLGTERTHLLGKNFRSLVIPEDQARWTRHLISADEDDQQGVAELTLRRGDGSVLHARIDYLRRAENTPSIRLALTDISHRKQVEIELIAAKQAAEKANVTKSRFLAAASHDLRQPILAINLFSYSLSKTRLSAEQKNISDHLSLAVRTLGDLLNVLLDISKLDAGVVKPVLEEMPSEDMFCRINANFSALLKQKGLRLLFHYPAREITLLTDQKLLLSLIGNLIGNAIKYTEQGGILIGIRRRGKCAVIQIWDTGIGIAPEHIDDIFDEYFQVGNPALDRAQGLGLGLSIVRRLAKLLDVQVSCRSRPGRGTVFEICLPMVEEPANPGALGRQPAHENDRTASRFAGRSVVLIEDNIFVEAALEVALGSLGMSVIKFRNAEDALANPEVAEADYYVSDFRLPGMNGLQVLDAIQQRTSKPIKALLLTGDSSPDRIELTQSCRWTVLFKPVDFPTLLSALATPDCKR